MAFGKRVDGPGGQRGTPREDVVLSAAVISATHALSAALMDVSRSGAKLQVHPLPSVGKDVLIRVGRFEAFGTVVWAGEGFCGVQFDVPIGDDDVQFLRNERNVTTLANISADEALGAQDWANGIIR